MSSSFPKPIVSAIVPCYNTEKYVRDCLESLLLQGDALAEIICVDDHSTDGTLKILNDFALRFPEKIKVLVNERNSGASFSRNRGIQEAKGTWIQLLDSDDVLLEGKIKHQLKILEQRPDAGFIAGAYRQQYENGKVTDVFPDTDDTWLALMRTRLGCTCSNLWRKDALLESGAFDMALKSSQEYDLMFRMLSKGFAALTDPEIHTLVRVRRQGSISVQNRAANWLRYAELRVRIVQYLRHSGQFNGSRAEEAFQILFNAIRILYGFDPKEALRIYRSEIPHNFQPEPSANTSVFYCRMYRIFGFSMTERIRRVLSAFR